MKSQTTKYIIILISTVIITIFSVLPFAGIPLVFAFVMLKYIALSESMNIISGYTGYVDFGHVMFYGLGVYWAALSIWNLKGILLTYPPLAILIAGFGCSLTALIIGSILLRLKGAYFSLAMLSLNEVVKLTLLNAPREWTGGTYGIALPVIYNPILAYYGMLILAIATVMLVYVIANSSFGICLKAIRDDEDAAEDMGIPTFKYKLVAFIISALIAGLVGGLDLWYTAYASPEINFEVRHTVDMLVMVLVGGAGTVFGPVIGTMVILLVRDYLWAVSPFLYLVIFGAVIVGVTLFMPYGILGVLNRIPKFKGKIK